MSSKITAAQTDLTAVLIFGNTSNLESSRKYLLEDELKNTKVLTALGTNTESVAAKTGLPIIRYTEKYQQGQSFGERITSGLERGFSLGYEKLVVIGTDCPDLSTNDVLTVARHTSAGQLSLGPDSHGGVYIFGIHQSDFDIHEFTRFAWQTNRLLDDLVSYTCRFEYCVHLLSKKVDINSIDDLLLLSECSEVVKKILKEIFIELRCFLELAFRIQILHIGNFDLRGPPLRMQFR